MLRPEIVLAADSKLRLRVVFLHLSTQLGSRERNDGGAPTASHRNLEAWGELAMVT